MVNKFIVIVALLMLVNYPAFAVNDIKITIEDGNFFQLQTQVDNSIQVTAIGRVHNVATSANVEITIDQTQTSQVQSNTNLSSQSIEVGRVYSVDGADIDIQVSDIDITQQQDGVSGAEQLVQIGAVIGEPGNPIHTNASINVMNAGAVVQEQTASNNAQQTVRIGVLTNGAYYP